MIQRIVAEYFGLSHNDLRGRKRTKAIVFPRQIAMYIVREITEYSTTEVGLEFGGRDQIEAIHTVLSHANADIITLNEADDREVVKTLAGRLRLHHIWAEGSGERHIATLTRFPIDEWHIYNRPPLTQAVLETRLETPSGLLTIYNAHFLPYLLLPFEVRRWQALGTCV